MDCIPENRTVRPSALIRVSAEQPADRQVISEGLIAEPGAIYSPGKNGNTRGS